MGKSNIINITKSTDSTQETEELAEAIGNHLHGGEVVELISDLGGGKTTFVRGFAKGAGSIDTVASPSFTIKREYYAKDLTIHHFDFYRLKEPGLIQHDLTEALENSNDIVIIEWADIVKGVLPAMRLSVHIKTTGENTRQITFKAPESLKYLLKDLQ